MTSINTTSKTSFAFTVAQITVMFRMQDALNTKLQGVDWREKKLNWPMAMSAELVEAADHWGWKWWAKQEPNLPQVHMELVDVGHFLFSAILEHNPEPAEVAEIEIECDNLGNSFVIGCSKVLGILNDHDGADLWNVMLGLQLLCIIADLTPEQFFKLYVGKNLLNQFRKEHGYKEGTYIKNWNGREDNEVLADLLDAYSPEVEGFEELILSELEIFYTKQVRKF